MTDIAADEPQRSLREGRRHLSAGIRIVDELVNDQIAVLADIQRAAIEEGELRGAAALGGDVILEEDVRAELQRSCLVPWYPTGRGCVRRTDRADDLLRSGVRRANDTA